MLKASPESPIPDNEDLMMFSQITPAISPTKGTSKTSLIIGIIGI